MNLALSEAERKQFAYTLGPKSVPPMANRLSRKKLKSCQQRALLPSQLPTLRSRVDQTEVRVKLNMTRVRRDCHKTETETRGTQ